MQSVSNVAVELIELQSSVVWHYAIGQVVADVWRGFSVFIWHSWTTQPSRWRHYNPSLSGTACPMMQHCIPEYWNPQHTAMISQSSTWDVKELHSLC